MKRYEILVTIDEGSDEFWEGLERNQDNGINEILEGVREGVLERMPEAEVKLVKFTDQ